ncbi:MAG: hypothetical protein HN465_03345, partial [Nitrospina sp.]|nr:hypothetical protein [Nitrospina sp.]
MQKPLFPDYAVITTKDKHKNSDWGTFKDSLRAPLHSWFTYPAGFSHKAVQSSLDEDGIKVGQTVYDPFMGSGTTNLVAKTKGINSIGIEAHPFVFDITQTKFCWDLKTEKLKIYLEAIEKLVLENKHKRPLKLKEFLGAEFPELISKCFLPETLYDLLGIRNFILSLRKSAEKRFLKTALICALRKIS